MRCVDDDDDGNYSGVEMGSSLEWTVGVPALCHGLTASNEDVNVAFHHFVSSASGCLAKLDLT